MLKFLFRWLTLASVAVWVCACGAADVQHEAERLSPDFVHVSLLRFGPGEDLISCFGHVCLRMECSAHGLDYCFSCESESIRENLLPFVTGRLKAGIFAVPTKDFLPTYAKDGRSCRQYPLSLSPEVKQRLWKILDERVSAGRSLPYDYVRLSCVQAVLRPLLEAMRPCSPSLPRWDLMFTGFQRESLANDLAWCPWIRFALQTLIGTEVDREVRSYKSVLHPDELIELLRHMTLDGRPLLTGEGDLLFPQQEILAVRFFTPVVFGIGFLLLSIFNCFYRSRIISTVFLVFQTVLGLFLTYLLFMSSLPATDWNWLIIPFNPLPVFCWKWRRKWGLAFCCVLCVWEAFMIVYPCQLTDPAYYLIVAAYGLFWQSGWRTLRHP